jgi:hypothetical protein
MIDAARARLDVVPRVLITGSEPRHLSPAQAQAWLRAELASLRALPGVESVVLTRVEPSIRHPLAWTWLCELHLADRADTRACAEHPACIEGLMDLRLLGMRPALAILGGGEQVL